MINLSKIVRGNINSSLENKFVSFFDPEAYQAENVHDYLENMQIIRPPLFKRKPLSKSNSYAIVFFYNVCISGILNNEKLVENLVNIHDESGLDIMFWNSSNDSIPLYPMKKSYPEMLDEGLLEINDFVYRLTVKHSYEGNQPFIAGIEKYKILRKTKNKSEEKIGDFFPGLVPQPSY